MIWGCNDALLHDFDAIHGLSHQDVAKSTNGTGSKLQKRCGEGNWKGEREISTKNVRIERIEVMVEKVAAILLEQRVVLLKERVVDKQDIPSALLMVRKVNVCIIIRRRRKRMCVPRSVRL